LTNDEAGPGTYYLTNFATLTENDTEETDGDDAMVTINVPSYVDLDVELDSNVTWEEEIIYDWPVEKTVDPTEVTLPVGESVQLDYTITATRNIHTYDSTYTISGTVTVINYGNVEATGVNVDVELYETGDAKNLATGETIAANDYKNYGFEFVTKNYHSSYRVIATVTADAHPDVTKDNTKDTPIDPEKGQYIDETATVVDTITYVPTGFIMSFQSLVINPPVVIATRHLDENDLDENNSVKFVYSVNLKNDSYYEYSSTESFILPTECIINDNLEVLNKVVLTEDDSGDKHQDEAKVIIHIPECVCETAWATGTEFDTAWSMYFYLSEDEEATTVELIAAKHYYAGTVTAKWNNDGGVEITFDTGDTNWKMKQVHVEVVDEPSEFPNWPKSPPPGQFEVNIEFHNDSPTYWNSEAWYGENFDFGIFKDSGVYIAAHAVVINCDDYFEE
jgi:hypothetical protein